MTSQILEFTISNCLYVLDTRTGLYATTVDATRAQFGTEVGLQDMLGIPGFSITKIINKTRIIHHRVEKNQSYIYVSEGVNLQGNILSIYYKKNRAVVDFQPTDRRRAIIRAVDLTAVYDIPATVTATPTPTNPTTTTTNNTTMLNRLERIIIDSYTRSIRLERTLRTRRETLAQFIEKFFIEWNGNNEVGEGQGEYKNTIYVDNHEVQTDWGRRRSLGDIFMICKYYYPACTLREVLQILTTIVSRDHFRTSWCNTIRKKVWYYDTNASNATLNQEKQDEYGYTWSQYLQALRN
jgi:hypothetical protein